MLGATNFLISFHFLMCRCNGGSAGLDTHYLGNHAVDCFWRKDEISTSRCPLTMLLLRGAI